MTNGEVQEAAYAAAIVKIDNLIAKANGVVDQFDGTEGDEEARLIRSTFDYILHNVVTLAQRHGLFTEQHGVDSVVVRCYVINGGDR